MSSAGTVLGIPYSNSCAVRRRSGGPRGTPPPARAHHSAIYDPTTNRMVIYGGDDATGPTPTMFGDVWVLTNADGTNGTPAWTPLAPAGSPPIGRTQHAAVYDEANNLLIVFGGNPAAASCSPLLDDVWVLSNANGLGGTPTWTVLAPTGPAPAARRSRNVGYDPVANRLLVFGGELACVATDNQVWALDGANGLGGTPAWTQLAPTGEVPASWSAHSGVYDVALNRMTVFGGQVSSAFINVVRSLRDANGLPGAPAWVDLTPTSYRPVERAGNSAILDGPNHRMVIFGGLAVAGRLRDTWVLEQNAGRVVDVPPVDPPVAPSFTGFSRSPSPNPSRGTTSFSLAVARDQRVEVAVYDLAGRRVADLYRGTLPTGEHALAWDGRARYGAHVAAGLYLLRFTSAARSEVRRLVVLR